MNQEKFIQKISISEVGSRILFGNLGRQFLFRPEELVGDVINIIFMELRDVGQVCSGTLSQ